MESNAGALQHAWVARPWLARLIRVTAYLVPIAASIGVAVLLSSLGSTPTTAAGAVARWSGIAVVSTMVLVAVERLTRRLLPLSTLFTLTLAFPDRVPSRFKIAIRVGTTAQLRRRLDEVRRGEVGDTPGEVAERLLELVGLLSKHDRMTRGHSERVRAYSHIVGRQMGLSGVALDRLRWAALLHDIGKLTVSAEILNKPGRLTDEEFEEIKTHPMAGRSLVEPLRSWLGDSVRAVWEHHERFDGGGYPQGLAGADISLEARIVCVTDSFDVMTSTRSYKKPMPAADARRELARCSGTQFDPTVVRAFLSVSLGRLETRTGPAAWLAQAWMFPRALAAQLAGSVATGTAIGVGVATGVAGLAASASTLDQPLTVPAEFVRAEPAVEPAEDAPLDRSDGAADPGGAADPPAGAATTGTTAAPGTDEAPAGAPDVTPPAGGVSATDDEGVTLPGPTAIPTPSGVGTLPGSSINETVPGTPITVAPPIGGLPGSNSPPSVTLPPVTTVPVATVTVPPVTTVTAPPTVTVPPSVTLPTATTVPTVTVPPVTVPPVTVPPVTVPPVPTVSVATTLPPLTVPPVTVATTLPPVTVPPVTTVSVATTVPPVTTVSVATTVPPTTVPPVIVPPAI